MKQHTRSVCLTVFLVLLALFTLSACAGGETEKKIESVTIDFTTKAEYVRNEKIDLSGLTVTLHYEGGTTETVGATDTRVQVSGAETATAGEHTMTVSFGESEKSFSYSVRDTRLTLSLGDGSADGEKIITVTTPENYTSIASYLPTPDAEGYEFAGWFFDEALTRPVTYNLGDRVDTSADLTLYAGYDIDYTGIFGYTVENGEVTIHTFDPTKADLFELHIPSTVRLLPVVKIADGFFEESGVSFSVYSELIFGEDSKLREIGKNAFAFASFDKITLPGTLVTIGEGAFAGVQIEEIAFPDSLERIEKQAFESCISLRTATFGENSHLNYIGEEAFSLCSALDRFSIPDSTVTVSQEAFSACESLVSVHIGKNVKSVGLHSFRACSNLREIDVDPENAFFSTVNSDLYTKNGKELIRYCFGKNEKEYTVPDGVTDIQESAFDGFNINPYLETIYLPDTLVSIWAYAFRDCSANFVIPASVKNIGSNAFSGNGLTAFRIAEDNKSFTVSDGILYTKDMRELVAVPSYIVADTLTLDRRVEKVRSGALKGNANLRYLVIPADSSLTYLEQGSIVPGSCKSLCGIYIGKAEPFSMAGDAMAGDSSLLYDKCLIYIDRNAFGAYTEAWKNCVLTGPGALSEVLLTSRMVSQDNLSEVLTERIASFLGLDSLGDTEALEAALALYVDEYSASFYNFQDTFLLLDGAYRSGYDLTAVMPYLTVFETGALRYLIRTYANYTDYQFGTNPAFDLLNRHYETLPTEIRTTLSDVTADISALLVKTRQFEEKQRSNIAEIGAIASDPAHFDRDRAYAAYEKARELGYTDPRAVYKSKILKVIYRQDKKKM
ncbi:MAG TPA: hypothetical protein DDY70_04505 [Clostridiales bacterium]|nr:hypothetical protein [Clostridiales bacterium]